MPSPLGAPRTRYFDANGEPLAGGLLYTYVAGTNTPKATYTTAVGDVENTNPVVLDANGEASVYLAAEPYKLVLKDANDVTQWTEDDVLIGGAAAASVSEGTNIIDNGSCEVLTNRPLVGANGANPVYFVDRWCGWRQGATGYTISATTNMGLPASVSMHRSQGDAATESLVIGQHMGGSGAGGIFGLFDLINRALAPQEGEQPKVLVFSCYLRKGTGFSGTGATIEIVSCDATTENVLAGSGRR